MKNEIKIKLFEYDNFRSYLRDVYQSLKATKKQFSFRYFSKIAGFSSPNFMKLVIDGKRNLTHVSIEKIAQGLGFNKDETYYFTNLVLLNQAKTSDEKQKYAQEIVKSPTFKKNNPLGESEFNYFSHWYFVPVRELLNLKGFVEDPQWIAARVTPSITPNEATKALEELQKLGLIKRNEEGKLVPSDLNITTASEVTSPLIAHWHKTMMRIASESIDRFPKGNREISAAAFCVSEQGAKKVKELIQHFRNEILAVTAQESDPDRVYQLNFQFFPVTKKSSGENY